MWDAVDLYWRGTQLASFVGCCRFVLERHSVSETSIDTVSNGHCLVKCDAVIRWSLLTCHVGTEREYSYSCTLP